jgi:hypothetical protein
MFQARSVQSGISMAQEPTIFELIIKLTTGKATGSPSLEALPLRADKVIE